MFSTYVTFFVEGLIALFFLNSTFTSVKSKKYMTAVYLISYGFLMGLSFFQIIPLNLIAFTLINFLIICIIYNPGIPTSLFYSIIMTCVMGFSELLFSGFADNFQTEPTLRNTSIVLFFVFSKFTYFILLMIISRFSHNASKDDTDAKKAFANIILLIITILTLLEMFGLYHVLCYAILPVLDSIILIICCVCTIIIDILCVYFMDYITAKNSELLQLHLQLQAETERNYANKILEQSYENQQILIHDMKNHLNTISNLLSGSESDNAVEYINSLITSKELNTRVRYCSDARLNAILNRYVQMFDKESIQCNIDVCNSDTGFIKSEHLTSLICNILDNSIEACKNITDASVNIKISQVGSGKSTFISVSNSCIEKPVTNKTGEFITTKPDSIHHGYGLKSIKKIVSYYNGNMQAYYDDSTHLFYILITLEDLL